MELTHQRLVKKLNRRWASRVLLNTDVLFAVIFAFGFAVVGSRLHADYELARATAKDASEVSALLAACANKMPVPFDDGLMKCEIKRGKS
ncbi:MAG: hypothetical protein A2143_00605 [Gallionellales bacterium RBG_16_57_15]|nr:MAG: hypothetical protein A2143_00605 [Gallionellales bacterium RBG_16_57_15]